MLLRKMKKLVRKAMPGRKKPLGREEALGRKKALVRERMPVRQKEVLAQQKALLRIAMPVRQKKVLVRLMTVAGIALLLNACAKPQAGCNSVSCRPQSDVHKLTIWWQPELRNGPYDFTQVPVNN